MPGDMDSLMLKQIAEIEQKDESQVLAELAGEQIEEMIYSVEVYDRKSKKKRLTEPVAPKMKSPNRCDCGRNLLYPLEQSEASVTCRCGRRHRKNNLV